MDGRAQTIPSIAGTPDPKKSSSSLLTPPDSQRRAGQDHAASLGVRKGLKEKPMPLLELAGTQETDVSFDEDPVPEKPAVVSGDPLYNPNNSSEVHIDGLPASFGDPELRQLAAKLGRPLRLMVIHPPKLQKVDLGNIGYALVEYATVDEAQHCIKTLSSSGEFHPSFAQSGSYAPSHVFPLAEDTIGFMTAEDFDDYVAVRACFNDVNVTIGSGARRKDRLDVFVRFTSDYRPNFTIENYNIQNIFIWSHCKTGTVVRLVVNETKIEMPTQKDDDASSFPAYSSGSDTSDTEGAVGARSPSPSSSIGSEGQALGDSARSPN